MQCELNRGEVTEKYSLTRISTNQTQIFTNFIRDNWCEPIGSSKVQGRIRVDSCNQSNHNLIDIAP